MTSDGSTEGGVDRQVERERKFDLEPDAAPPDLTAAFPLGARAESDTVRLVSAYFDTADRDLLAVGITLRKRTGDTDTGWQLKVPVGDSRTELRLPLSAARTRVPRKLADLVAGIALGAPLTPLVTVHTERRRRRWSTPDGALLAEIADDDVKATAPDAPTDIWSAWRELEVGAGPAGDESLLDSVADLLLTSGATPGSFGEQGGQGAGRPTGPQPVGEARSPPAGPSWTTWPNSTRALLTGDLGLRTGTGDDVVHDTRVAVRRMRSTLAGVRGPVRRRAGRGLRRRAQLVRPRARRRPGCRGAARPVRRRDRRHCRWRWCSARWRPGSTSTCWSVRCTPSGSLTRHFRQALPRAAARVGGLAE